MDLVQFKFPYLGLPGLDARAEVESDNLLGVALSGLMRVADKDRAWLKAQAMQRIATAALTERQRFLLMECVEAYSPLQGPHLDEFQRLLLTEEFKMALTLAKTSFERGEEKGLEKGEVIGQIHAFQMILKQPITPREELQRLSLEELTQQAEQLKRQVLPETNGTS